MVVTKHTLLIIDCSLRDAISTDMTLVLNFIRVVFLIANDGDNRWENMEIQRKA